MPKDKPDLQGREFESLLEWLSHDSELAAAEYVRLHERLTKKFESRGCPEPEALADETFNRVAGQLVAGKEIHTTTPIAYLSGVANFVMKERCWRGPVPVALPDIPPAPQFNPDEANEKERRHACLDECLAKLPAETRVLVLDYYSEDKTRKIDTRDRMAKRLGIASGVLRNRIFKLRSNLRSCVAECLARVQEV
jgi:DNA-directed RNA polymerase specialized sigma24 family protein